MDEDQYEELLAQLDDERAKGLDIIMHDLGVLVVDDLYYDAEAGRVVIKVSERWEPFAVAGGYIYFRRRVAPHDII